MKRRPKPPLPTENLAPSAADTNAIVQVKVCAWHQPDGVAARAGALGLHPARAARRVPGRDGLGRHTPLSVLPSRSPLRFVGTVGVLAGRDPGSAAIP